MRFAIGAACIGFLYALGKGRPGPRRGRQLGAVILCGLLSGLAYGLVYAGEQSISGATAAVLYGTFPICTAILATLGRVEKVTGRAVAGSLVALAGIAVIFADRFQVSSAQGVGVLLVLVSVVISSLYTTILKREASDVNPLATTGVFLATSAVALGLFGACVDHRPFPWPPPAGPTVALLYLAIVGSVAVFAAYFYLLKRVSLMTISTLVLVEPVIALVVDAVGEHDVVLVPRTYAGMGVTVAGIALSVLRPSARS